MRFAIDMTGNKYGSLTAKSAVSKSKNGNVIWLFYCDCGEQQKIDGYAVRSQKVTSCKKCSAERVRLASVTHGMSSSPEFSVWTDIQSRCLNKRCTSYENYGGRGIKVCDRWIESFESFYADMGGRPTQKHSIDRIDVNGDYTPDNCRWATDTDQANNKRNNREITINGITKNLSQWAKDSTLSAATILHRLKSGKTGASLVAPSESGGTITFNGETHTYKAWSQKTGIKASTIAMRICTYGWSVEEALTKGAKF